MNIKNQQIITIQKKIYGENTFFSSINLNFIPQFMTVKYFSILLQNNDDVSLITDQLFIIKSSLINYDPIIHFTLNNIIKYDPVTDLENYSGSISQCINTTYKLFNRIINGNYEFQLLTGTNTVPINIENIFFTCVITLEFLSYE